VIKFVKGEIKVISQLTNFFLENFKTVLQEHITSKVVTINRWGKIGVSSLSRDFLLLHLGRSCFSHLIFIKVGINKRIEFLGEDLVQPLAWLHVLEILHVANLFADRQYLLSLVLPIEWINKRLDVLKLLRPVFLLENDSLFLPKVINLSGDSRLYDAFSLLETVKQNIVSTRELSTLEGKKSIDRID